jgi:hypothetical protein
MYLFSVKIMRKEGEKEEMRAGEEKGVRLFLHENPLLILSSLFLRTTKVSLFPIIFMSGLRLRRHGGFVPIKGIEE